MVRRKKENKNTELSYSKTEAFENLQAAQQLALNRKNKDDESNPDISVFLKAEELKGKLCGLYSDKIKNSASVNVMESVKIDGIKLEINVGEEINTE